MKKVKTSEKEVCMLNSWDNERNFATSSLLIKKKVHCLLPTSDDAKQVQYKSVKLNKSERQRCKDAGALRPIGKTTLRTAEIEEVGMRLSKKWKWQATAQDCRNFAEQLAAEIVPHYKPPITFPPRLVLLGLAIVVCFPVWCLLWLFSGANIALTFMMLFAISCFFIYLCMPI